MSEAPPLLFRVGKRPTAPGGATDLCRMSGFLVADARGLVVVVTLLALVLLAPAGLAARVDAAPCGLAAPAAPVISPAPPAPVVSYPAQPAGAVTGKTATLNGLVDAGGDGAMVVFEYGTSTGYGSCTSVQLLSSAAGAQQVTAQVAGLAPGTTYQFRLDAASAAGTTLGAGESFTTAASPPSPRPPSRPTRAEHGVMVGGVRVGGLTRQAASRAVKAAFAAPLQFRFEGKRWKVTPAQLGARADVDAAIRRALSVPGGTQVPVRVSINGARVGAYVSYLASIFDKPAEVADIRLVDSHAVVTPGKPGVAVQEQAMQASIRQALVARSRAVLPLLATTVAPPTTGKKVVVIRLGDQSLTAYADGKVVLTTPVTTGRPALPTPVGSYFIHFRASPYTFISPWPKGNPYYYPPTPATWAMYFFNNDFLHDDPAQPDGTYGKGSNYGGYASHGCVHVPHDTMRFLYDWLPVGAAVIVADS